MSSVPAVDGPGSAPRALADALSTLTSAAAGCATQVHWFERVGSTNDVARDLAARGAPEGTVVLADAQEAGRGRFGRAWASPAGAGLYCSILLRPAEPWPTVTLAAGVAATRALRMETRVPVTLKWPNDLYVRDRKLGGILAEGGHVESGPFVIVGIGINVRAAAYPPDVAARATALEDVCERSVDRWMLCARLLDALVAVYADARAGRSVRVMTEWRELAQPVAGRSIEWGDGAARHAGVARTVDDDGALVVEAAEGVHRIVSGEVRWL